MAMGTRKQREKQEGLWIAHTDLASAPGHPFYQRLNELLEAERFDELVEKRCAKFYAAKYGRPSLTPGIYFRALLIGYFEGIGAERDLDSRMATSTWERPPRSRKGPNSPYSRSSTPANLDSSDSYQNQDLLRSGDRPTARRPACNSLRAASAVS
jgi:hypothetical protein